MPTTRERGAMPTCDCTSHADTGTHGSDCIHWDLPTDDPSDHYGL